MPVWPGAVAGLLDRCTFPTPGAPPIGGWSATCAVSGGPDSLALLALACAAGLDVTAIHVDHRSHAGSERAAAVVASAAHRLGAGFESRRIAEPLDGGPNLEARWRAARRQVLPAGTMTGHTADDQAETVLLNLLRGSGAAGLAGMRPGPTKPILGLRRRDTEAVCDALGLEVVRDPWNDDRRFLRNRVRAEVLPLLDDLAGRDVAALLARQAEGLRADDDLLDALAGEAVPDPADCHDLAAAPAPLARRAVRRWLTSSEGHPLDARSVERVLAVARNEAEACELPGGVRVERSGMRLRVRAP